MNSIEAKRSARRQSDLVSIKALADLLRDVADNATSHLQNETLLAALNSQGALAKYGDSDASIRPMSLNHQRLIADTNSDGYGSLDALRKAALRAVIVERSRIKRGSANTKKGLIGKVRDLESDLALVKQDLALLQWAYDMRCTQARRYAAAADSSTQSLCAKEQKEIDATFSLRRKPIAQTTVVAMEEARKNVRRTK